MQSSLKMFQYNIPAVALIIVGALQVTAEMGMFDYSSQCVKTSGITEDAAKSIQEGILPTNQKEKCYVACVLKSIGVVDGGGKVSASNANRLIDMYSTETEEAKTKTKQTVNECAKEANRARGQCEVSYRMMSCVIKKRATKAQTRNITIGLPQSITIKLPPLSFTLFSVG